MDSNNLPNKKRRIETTVKTDLEDSLYNLLINLQEKNDTYLNIPNIIKEFKTIIEENSEGMINRCTVCQVDMGRCNPRQLCGKTYCCSEY